MESSDHEKRGTGMVRGNELCPVIPLRRGDLGGIDIKLRSGHPVGHHVSTQ
jgi:hypothetical protein